MPPILHTFLGFLLSCLGAVAGLGLWSLLFSAAGLDLPAKAPLPASPYGLVIAFGVIAIAFCVIVVPPFLGVWALWTKYVPARCRRCGGRMTIRPGRGRQIIYACPSCGERR